MFKKILIANRGEIACRIARTCHRLGIHVVAIYSEADRNALHVSMADESILVGPAPAAESYLAIEAIIAAAKNTRCEAIHPGYGFLSESADFAKACATAGLVFIGPRADTIALMGLKSAAKSRMRDAGVPVVPGYEGANQDLDFLLKQANKIGFPLMLKASAGGGGKGMRAISNAKEFRDGLKSARRESMAAFGDDRILLERLIQEPRHIEIQVLADAHGHTLHLFERECTLQRRFQKVLEETPSCFLDDTTRMRMGEAAIAAAKAVNYLGAGTVEFIVDAKRKFYFMEMNTRLQVEHPVTEMTTGLDLVEWQIKIAAGESLPYRQESIAQSGHAIEVRLYAEDPQNEFLPSPGRIREFKYPVASNVRVDTGIESGDEVTPDYDPMIAKIVVHDADRDRAISKLQTVLAETALFGNTSNLHLLRGIARHKDFHSGAFDTGFLDRELSRLLAPDKPCDLMWIAFAAEYLKDLAGEWLDTPWRPDGWRLVNGSGWRVGCQLSDGQRMQLWVSGPYTSPRVALGDRIIQGSARLHKAVWVLQADNEAALAHISRCENQMQISLVNRVYNLRIFSPFEPALPKIDKDIHPVSPMPGRVVALNVAVGDRVTPGSALLVLEGMKMEYTLKAKVDGVVKMLLCQVGDRVYAETPLVDIEPDERQ